MSERPVEARIMCSISDNLSADDEKSIALRVAYRAVREMSIKANGKAGSGDSPEMLKFKQLVGGYINYLKQNDQELLSTIDYTEENLSHVADLAQFTSYMRARPSKIQTEDTEKEMCFRLTEQITRLAVCLSVVMNRPGMDEEVMKRVHKVAMDTCKGRTLKIAQQLYRAAETGMEPAELAILTHQSIEEEKKLLIFLRKIHVVESFKIQGKSSTRWRLTRKMMSLYALVGPK